MMICSDLQCTAPKISSGSSLTKLTSALFCTIGSSQYNEKNKSRTIGAFEKTSAYYNIIINFYNKDLILYIIFISIFITRILYYNILYYYQFL